MSHDNTLNQAAGETTPDELMAHFKGKKLGPILMFTVVVHVVVLLGTSIPWLLAEVTGGDNSELSEEERIAFLHRFYPAYPWARDPDLPRQIENRTRTRLLRELNRICGY